MKIRKTKKYQDLQKLIINHLTVKGVYEDVDQTLIEELIFCYQIADNAKAEIRKNGSTVNVRENGKDPYYQQSSFVGVYNNAVKQIKSLSTALAITPNDRLKLKLENENSSNEFSEFI